MNSVEKIFKELRLNEECSRTEPHKDVIKRQGKFWIVDNDPNLRFNSKKEAEDYCKNLAEETIEEIPNLIGFIDEEGNIVDLRPDVPEVITFEQLSEEGVNFDITEDGEVIYEESSDELKKKAKKYLDKKGYHNYLKGDYDKNRLALKIAGEKANEAEEDDDVYEYKGHTIAKEDDKWVVDDNEDDGFATDSEAEAFIDELEDLPSDDEGEKEDQPQKQRVYWDKDHENAFYVVEVYPEEDKVSYWTQDGQRRQTSIENFMRKYELSTNEDDYDLFEEVNEESYPQKYLKALKEAKSIIKLFTKNQIDYVEKAYKDAVKDPKHFNSIRNEWAAYAAEDEIFDDDNDFDILFDAIDVVHEQDAIANS